MEGLKLSKLFWGVLDDVIQADPKNGVAKRLYNFQVDTGKVNYLDVSSDGGKVMASFLPTGKPCDPGDQFFTNLRQVGRLGATIQKVMDSPISADDLRKFVDLFSAKFLEHDYAIEVVSGKDMIQWYFLDNYAPGEGSELWKSCMRYEHCRDYLDFYAENRNLRMAIAKNNDGKLARALIWDNVELCDDDGALISAKLGKTHVSFLDRIYATSPQAKSVMWRWALKNVDMMHTQPKNALKFTLACDRTIYDAVHMRQSVDKMVYYYYPWVDSLMYLSFSSRMLTNYASLINSDYVKLHTTNGVFERMKTGSPYLDDIRALALRSKK
jgi:hypothetical protein